jgi:DNA helicase II / ATP-dependent DNA helicase PcrA
VVYSRKDVPALQRIINVPPRRIGKERIAVLLKIAEAKNRTLWDSCQAMITGEIKFDQAAAKSMEVFVACVTQTRRKLASKEIVEVSDVIDHIRESLGYDDYLRKKFGVEADERIVNLEELKTFAKEVDKVTEENVLPEIGVIDETIDEESPLARFLGNIALMTDVRDDADDKSDSVSHLYITSDP